MVHVAMPMLIGLVGKILFLVLRHHVNVALRILVDFLTTMAVRQKSASNVKVHTCTDSLKFNQ